MAQGAETPVARAAERRLVDEWALVLVAEGLAPTIRRAPGGWAVVVPEGQAAAAEVALAAYARESRPAPVPPPVPAWTGDGPLAAALAVAGGLLAFHRVTGPWRDDTVWFARGAADAQHLLGGEPWRAVTALTLHADTGHVFGNALAAALLVTLVGRALGPGLAVLAVLAAGAGGNVANAWLHAGDHLSVGASTAVFGAVGLLGGLGAARRRLRLGRRPAWTSLGASLGLLAMLGTGGERTDLWAHGFGLAVGLALGAVLGFALRRPPALAWQILCGAAAAAVVAASWRAAMA